MMIDAAQNVVAQDGPPQVADMNRRRDALAELLGRYQRFKHRDVFDPVVKLGSASRAIAARRMKTECILMGQQFEQYCTRWTGLSTASDWQAYRVDMRTICDQLVEHLRSEAVALRWLTAIEDLYALVPGRDSGSDAGAVGML